ncbi:hypothetical protein NKH77_01220 [Streptomyces sp. M19]
MAVYDGPADLTPPSSPPVCCRPSAPPRARPCRLRPRQDRPGPYRGAEADHRRALDNPALLVQDHADVRAEVRAGTSTLLSTMYALLSVTVLIGVLG